MTVLMSQDSPGIIVFNIHLYKECNICIYIYEREREYNPNLLQLIQDPALACYGSAIRVVGSKLRGLLSFTELVQAPKPKPETRHVRYADPNPKPKTVKSESLDFILALRP